jgi:L-fuculose-phosphate aldolase
MANEDDSWRARPPDVRDPAPKVVRLGLWGEFMSTLDLSDQNIITLRDVEAASEAGATEIIVCGDITPLARGLLNRLGICLRHGSRRMCINDRHSRIDDLDQVTSAYGQPAGKTQQSDGVSSGPAVERLFHSPRAESIKREICAVGKKLWRRSYVDGNGGNISYRISENAVLCTPTLLSKADVTPDDICMVDLSGNQIAGKRPRTSEIFLHLEIYKSVPAASGVVHCHPPHATAYAITGHIPPSGVVPEFDVFVGTVAVTPYETPGTQAFAETVLPYVKSHNTILLGNHGIVCWADTVTHAEWCAEVLETYCWTLTISRQMGVPYSRISPAKEQDLLAIKKRLGLPDARFDMPECVLSGLPERPGAIAFPPPYRRRSSSPERDRSQSVEAIVRAATDGVMAALPRRILGSITSEEREAIFRSASDAAIAALRCQQDEQDENP